jgi:cellulose synthase/poly-beta-1,6-N-acetylglucosamine synthase-like glycosyltransferase
VEYLRAFLFGRLGWSPMNALLIISGAFGIFRKQALVEAGGYRTATIGEDMELVVRLHRQHRLARRPYRIVYLPDPLCWTEAPESLSVLRSQRIRWQRGLLESLAANRQLLFHPRGGAPGWLAFPVMLLFEAMGPVVELSGWVLSVLAVLLGGLAWQAVAALLVAALGLSLLLSVSALLLEEMSFHFYERPRQSLALLGAIALENLGYRQLTAWWRLLAILQWASRRKARWGNMQRSAAWQGKKE